MSISKPNPKRIAAGIKAAITMHIKNSMNSDNPQLRLWYCGITNNEVKRKAAHIAKRTKVDFWKIYNASTLEIAHSIEFDLSLKGTNNCKHKGGANESSIFVYVFKTNPKKGLAGINELLTLLTS